MPPERHPENAVSPAAWHTYRPVIARSRTLVILISDTGYESNSVERLGDPDQRRARDF